MSFILQNGLFAQSSIKKAPIFVLLFIGRASPKFYIWMQQQEKNNKELWKLTESYKKNYQPDVNQGLVILKNKISRTHATKRSLLQRRVLQMAAAVLILIGSGAVYQLFFANNSTTQQLFATNTLVHKTLPDGSEVLLNKHSQLSFPKKFEGDKRIVQLNGEAYFKIKKDQNQPFIVQTSATEVEVLGTSFNLRAYAKEEITSLKVEEGRVAIHLPDSSNPTILTANQKVQYAQSDQTLKEITATNWEDTAWHTSKLTFDNTPLSEIISYLTTNFDVHIEVLSPSLSQCPLTATLVDNDPLSILKRIEKTFQVQLNTTDANSYSLSGVCQ